MTPKTQEFIEKAKLVHGDKYDYSEADYINNHTKVKIFCHTHGMFDQTPKVHLNGSVCRKCAHTITNEQFIVRAKEVHNDKYDYLSTVYMGMSDKLEISCIIHGNFIQKALTHIQGGNCPKCAKKSSAIKRTLTTEQFKERAILVHGDLYVYDKVLYEDNRINVEIFCKYHGYFKQKPNTHLNGNGCMLCGNLNKGERLTKSQEQFITEVNLTHDNKYSYPTTKYKNSRTKVDILCEVHGIFNQLPQNHIKGQGCPKCKNEKNAGGYGKNDYIKRASGRICTFYTLRCFNEEEEFYKIGITMNTVKKRYNSLLRMPYVYEIVSELYGEAGFIWDLEVAEKKKLTEFHYKPELDFKGSKSECFTRYKI